MNKVIEKIKSYENVSQTYFESAHNKANIGRPSLITVIEDEEELETRISPTSVIQNASLGGDVTDNVGVFFNQEFDWLVVV